MKICKAFKEDLDEILKLQYLAYQSEAKLFKTQDIPPLKQTLEEVEHEYNTGEIKKQNHIIRYRNDECLQLKKEQVL